MNGARKSKKHARINKPKKYVCIAKVGNKGLSINTGKIRWGAAKCIKHRLNDLLKYVAFLDAKHPTWTWFNVYANTGENKGVQIGNFTKNERPISREL